MCLHFLPLYKMKANISLMQALPSCDGDVWNQSLPFGLWSHGIEVKPIQQPDWLELSIMTLNPPPFFSNKLLP